MVSPRTVHRVLSALGALSAVLLGVGVNALSHQHYRRWDWTAEERYTLSDTARRLLDETDVPTVAWLLLPSRDERRSAVEELLRQFEAASPTFKVTWLDPDRHASQVLELGLKYRLWEASPAVGRGEGAVAVLLVQGERHWTIPARVFDDASTGGSTPAANRWEPVIVDALRGLQGRKPMRACFAQGHGERGLTQGGRLGVSALGQALRRENLLAEDASFDAGDPDSVLSSCRLVLVVAPTRPWRAADVEALVRATERGAAVLVAAGPILDLDQHWVASGLEPLLSAFGVRALPGFVFDLEQERALAGSAGDTFLAEVRAHAATRALGQGKVLMSGVLALEPQADWSGGTAAALLATSPRAIVWPSASLPADVGTGTLEERTRIVGWGAQRPLAAPSAATGRLIALGSANLLLGETFEDPSRLLEQRLVLGVVDWLVRGERASQAPARAVADAAPRAQLTQAARREAMRYVIVVMPATAFLMGVWVVLRRRGRPARESTPPGEH